MSEISGPTRLATALTTQIAEINNQLAVATTRQERRDLNRLLHRNRELLRWCRTRAGYRSERDLAAAGANFDKDVEA